MTWKRLSFQHAQLAGKAYAGLATEQPKIMPSAPQLSGHCKRISSAVHFYQNRNLEAYASRPATRMTLRQLVRGHFFLREKPGPKSVQVFFGKSMNEERLIRVRPPDGAHTMWHYMLVLQSANYVRTELPIRIAHRLRDMQALPYVVVTQEGVAKVYEVCLHKAFVWAQDQKLTGETCSCIGRLSTSMAHPSDMLWVL